MHPITAERGRPERLGATVTPEGIHFAVTAGQAERVELCLFEAGDIVERARLALPGRAGSVHFGFVPGLAEGQAYGFRAHGPFDPAQGLRFDASKLLVDPYALRLDRPFVYHPALGAPPERAVDTAPLVPRALAVRLDRTAKPLPFAAPGFTYELPVRAFTQHHPAVPAPIRGTVAALGHPAVLDHLTRLGVETVELMPLAAAIDERHLAALGLTNAWNYNPVCHMAPDPRLCPGGFPELREAADALHGRGIRVLLDVVLNHSGESDLGGPTLSYRGLDRAYYATDPDDPDRLHNHTGTGNTFALWREPGLELAAETLRTWVQAAGIDGFRYDLGTVLARGPDGFDSAAPLPATLREDPVLRERIHVMEPWDIGPGGYRVGAFGAPFLEWQDRFRDDVRRFWRGDAGMVSALATRLAGSPDLFSGDERSAAHGVNFVTAHDGFTLRDLVSYAAKHNEANGEGNRDGHGDNHSWNNGAEGATDDPAILAHRARDARALLATLMVARGNPMIVAGDEIGRTQGGNNNAYAQDNPTFWLDWAGADRGLAAFAGELAALRRRLPALRSPRFLLGEEAAGEPDVIWLGESGESLGEADWRDPERRFLALRLADLAGPVLVYLNAAQEDVEARLPAAPEGCAWRVELASDGSDPAVRGGRLPVPARAVVVLTAAGG